MSSMCSSIWHLISKLVGRIFSAFQFRTFPFPCLARVAKLIFQASPAIVIAKVWTASSRAYLESHANRLITLPAAPGVSLSAVQARHSPPPRHTWHFVPCYSLNRSPPRPKLNLSTAVEFHICWTRRYFYFICCKKFSMVLYFVSSISLDKITLT